MPLVSVTRFRARSIRFIPLFAFHANRAIAQVRKADGFIAGEVQRQADRALWTMTVWRDQAAMLAYMTSGAHGKAMPHLRDWGIEASVIRWTQDGAEVPSWLEAARRMREEGRPSRLRHPGPDHASLGFAETKTAHGMRL